MSSNENNLIKRPPVVVIMGHIDHGKSTLLDYIRSSNTVSKEAGGITQHLGAYEVVYQDNKMTFLDTPGHEAFSGVRVRGSKVADIAILIVSAEDGVKPQTLEALEIIKKHKVPYVVAINKIDSPKANVDLAKQSLIENEIYIEGYGGDVPVALISGKTGQGVKELLDLILLVIEMSELKYDPNILAEGFVVETHKDQNKGISAVLVIKNGTLRLGQFVSCRIANSPVRIMEDHNGNKLNSATASAPVKILGWNDIPQVGNSFKTFESKKEAEEYCKQCKNDDQEIKELEKKLQEKKSSSSEENSIIPIIIKADSQGSIEAILHELNKIELEQAEIKIVFSGTGSISENDIKLSLANQNTVVVGFGVPIDNSAKALSDRNATEVATFKIIYELIDWLKQEIEKRRPKIEFEEIIGKAKILKVFNNVKNNQVLGARLEEGFLKKSSKIKIQRRGEQIGFGTIKELQQQKTKVDEVVEGEFGTAIDSKIEIVPGDYLLIVEKKIR